MPRHLQRKRYFIKSTNKYYLIGGTVGVLLAGVFLLPITGNMKSHGQSVELGVASMSPLGPSGGFAIPASGESYPDYPSYAPPPTATLSTSPDTVNSGGACSLFWSSTDATSCTGIGFSTGGAIQNPSGGHSTGALTQTTSYQVYCTGAGGTSATVSATCTVIPPTVSIGGGPNPVIMPPGGCSSDCPTTIITWSVSPMTPPITSCTISGPGLSSTQVSGSQTITVTGQQTYTITCVNPNGGPPLVKSVTINVTSQFKEF